MPDFFQVNKLQFIAYQQLFSMLFVGSRLLSTCQVAHLQILAQNLCIQLNIPQCQPHNPPFHVLAWMWFYV